METPESSQPRSSTKEYWREYRKKNADRCRAYTRKWYNANKESRLLTIRAYKIANWAKRMVSTCRHRAKAAGLPFNIEPEDLEMPAVCPVLGIPLEPGTDHIQPNSPSVDRIIPDLGYTKGNVAVISARANSIKQNATWEEILKVGYWLKAVIERKGGVPFANLQV